MRTLQPWGDIGGGGIGGKGSDSCSKTEEKSFVSRLRDGGVCIASPTRLPTLRYTKEKREVSCLETIIPPHMPYYLRTYKAPFFDSSIGVKSDQKRRGEVLSPYEDDSVEKGGDIPQMQPARQRRSQKNPKTEKTLLGG